MNKDTKIRLELTHIGYGNERLEVVAYVEDRTFVDQMVYKAYDCDEGKTAWVSYDPRRLSVSFVLETPAMNGGIDMTFTTVDGEVKTVKGGWSSSAKSISKLIGEPIIDGVFDDGTMCRTTISFNTKLLAQRLYLTPEKLVECLKRHDR